MSLLSLFYSKFSEVYSLYLICVMYLFVADRMHTFYTRNNAPNNDVATCNDFLSLPELFFRCKSYVHFVFRARCIFLNVDVTTMSTPVTPAPPTNASLYFTSINIDDVIYMHVVVTFSLYLFCNIVNLFGLAFTLFSSKT